MKKSIILLLLCTLCSIINAQEFIDLGLSVNWCTVNIGASTSNETGNLYAWGEIEPKKHFSMENYKYKDPENDQWTVNIGNNISGT